ncbi:MAG: hypothetical protein BMS9Abin37_2011 [Acidobacteriota bacterium]|nr:MAG: hypothetical protein BMS9Abin37_2011 [Acidobacteriota bacterium]
MKALVVLALALSVADIAGAQTEVPVTDSARILIEYTAPHQLSNDFMVTTIRIVNQSGRDRSWVFEFHTPMSYSNVGRRSRFALDVENGEDRRFEILVPLAGAKDASWVQMFVFGFGVSEPGPIALINTVSSTVAVSDEATMLHESARQMLVGNHGPGEPLGFDVSDLTGDWRAYASLSALWLSAAEWRKLDPAVRRALTGWVAGGGRLVLVEPGETPSAEPIRRHGMGMIATIPAGLTDEDVKTFLSVLPPSIPNQESISWATSLINPIETPNGFLSLVLLGYLVLAAPVNLLVFTPGTKRMRLFWTMPAIALGASAAMAAVILLQDGVGGSGYRANFVYLQPELNRELIVQEQVSKTGALVRRSFEIEKPVVITGLATDHHYLQSFKELGSDGSRHTGDWFRSRSIQAQRLQWARSSRARVELVGAEGKRLTLLSSIDVHLDELYFRDERGQVWHAENVLPGRPAVLASSTEQEYERFWREVSSRTSGPAIHAHADAIRGLRGAFLASAASDVSDVAIETLTSIDWNDAPVLYAGHIQKVAR